MTCFTLPIFRIKTSKRNILFQRVPLTHSARSSNAFLSTLYFKMSGFTSFTKAGIMKMRKTPEQRMILGDIFYFNLKVTF